MQVSTYDVAFPFSDDRHILTKGLYGASTDVLGQTFAEIVDEALSRGATSITWFYNEPAGKDYTDAKNDPVYLSVLPFMIFRPELELKRHSDSSEYFINFYDPEISCIMVMKGGLVGWCLAR